MSGQERTQNADIRLPWTTSATDMWWLEGIQHQVVLDAQGEPVAYSYPGYAEMIVAAVNGGAE